VIVAARETKESQVEDLNKTQKNIPRAHHTGMICTRRIEMGENRGK
jgi:hypothetical protein